MHSIASSPKTAAGLLEKCLPDSANRSRSSLAILLILAITVATRAAEVPSRRLWSVDGVVREALVYLPVEVRFQPTPVVFAFHGHGGSMSNAARIFHLHTLWPDAIIVYPQGLNTPGRLTDAQGQLPGWQSTAGDQNDRDLKFFDKVLASLVRDYRIDQKRIYATGHSNGGGFTYLLWAERADKFAALAPAAAVAPRPHASLNPKPVLQVSGEQDALVKFEWQEQMIDTLRKLNQCGDGQPWEKEKGCTLYPSKIAAPVVTFIHPGGHQFPTEAPALIVKFFKEHSLP